MRNLILLFFITLISLTLINNEAFAKRFGAGRSFGVQRSQSSLSRQFTPQPSSSFAQKSNRSRWGGVLGGLLIGGLLATLFMGNGFAKGLLTWLILGAAVLFIVSLFRRKMEPARETFQANPERQSPFSHFTKSFTEPSSNGNFSEYPPNFNPEDFLRQAKVTFIRMQAAYDEKDLTDLQEFTAPEVFGEIKMQLDERGDEPNKTEVFDLEAQLLDISKQTMSFLASVRFTGSVKENDAPITKLDEIWHFRQFTNSSVWVVAGIQQEIIQPI